MPRLPDIRKLTLPEIYAIFSQSGFSTYLATVQYGELERSGWLQLVRDEVIILKAGATSFTWSRDALGQTFDFTNIGNGNIYESKNEMTKTRFAVLNDTRNALIRAAGGLPYSTNYSPMFLSDARSLDVSGTLAVETILAGVAGKKLVIDEFELYADGSVALSEGIVLLTEETAGTILGNGVVSQGQPFRVRTRYLSTAAKGIQLTIAAGVEPLVSKHIYFNLTYIEV